MKAIFFTQSTFTISFLFQNIQRHLPFNQVYLKSPSLIPEVRNFFGLPSLQSKKIVFRQNCRSFSHSNGQNRKDENSEKYNISKNLIFNLRWEELTVIDAVKHGTAILEQVGVMEAEQNTQYLLGRALGLGPSVSELTFLRTTCLKTLDFDAQLFQEMLVRRLDREPLQYILGDWDFHALTLKVKAPVLIPRPETEELVELVLNELRNYQLAEGKKSEEIRVLDVGCGSGAIGLAILKALPGVQCVGIDKNPEAISLSLENAKLLNLHSRYHAECVAIQDWESEKTFDLIVSNPPYIPLEDMKGLQDEVVKYEDFDALCGGNDGTNIIREILLKAPQILKEDSLNKVWMEVDTSHPEIVPKLLTQDIFKQQHVVMGQWKKDFAGNPRFIQFCIKQ